MNHGNLSIPSTKMVFLLALIIFTLVAACKTQEVQTRWSREPVKVDGETTEWASGSTVYFEDLGVQLGLSNDNRNLYVLFRFSNQAWARTIRTGGVTLWLDYSGKKKKDLGIRYTGGSSIADLPMQGSSSRGGFRAAMTLEMQQRLLEMEQNPAGQITLCPDGSDGPAAGFAAPQGIYTYEFSVPLEKGDLFDCGIGVEPGQVISLGFEWGGMSKKDRQKLMERMGGGMGGRPPSGMSGGRGGMGGRPGGPRMRPAEKQEFWVKTRLAFASEG